MKNLGQDCGSRDRSTEESWTIGVYDILNYKDVFLGEDTISGRASFSQNGVHGSKIPEEKVEEKENANEETRNLNAFV